MYPFFQPHLPHLTDFLTQSSHIIGAHALQLSRHLENYNNQFIVIEIILLILVLKGLAELLDFIF